MELKKTKKKNNKYKEENTKKTIKRNEVNLGHWAKGRRIRC